MIILTISRSKINNFVCKQIIFTQIAIGRFYALFAFFLLFSNQSAFAQAINNQIKDVVMPSPSTAAFGKYVDIPVSYHTGVPNISLPICSITDGTLELPISLSYHASGIKMAETASWVGLGWNLNAVGQVSRTVNGYADEKERGFLRDHLLNVTRPPVLEAGGYYNRVSSGGQSYPSSDGAILGEGVDYEPDMFSFSAGGYSGKFYIHPTDGVVMIPKQDIKIIYDDPIDQEIDYFTITTPEGDKYHFGKVNGAGVGQYEYASIPATVSSQGYADTRQTWYLVKIEDTNGNHSIDISYEKELTYNSNRIANSEYRVSVTGHGSPYTPFQYDVIIATGQNSLRVKKITNSSGTMEVNFNANTIRDDVPSGNLDNAKRLDEIVVKQGTTDDYTKKFVFSYDYLADNSCTSPHCKRLRLTQLQEISYDNSIAIPPHIFEYEGDNTYPNLGILQWCGCQ